MFKNLKVLDLSTVLAGPSVGTFFAELGAQVLKIEDLEHKDVTRTWKLKTEKSMNIGAYFSSVNYNKKYLLLNFNDFKDKEIIKQHIKKSDIVLVNFREEVAKKLGFDSKSLLEYNPKLIIGRIKGFDYNEDRPAYDMILQAESGFLSMGGVKESGPLKMPVAMIDIVAAHQLKEGLLCALIQKKGNKSFKGREISVSLNKAALTALVNQASNFLMNDYIPEQIGNLHPNIAPYGEIFTSKDMKKFTLAVGTNLQFKKLWGLLFNSTEIPEQFSTNQKRVCNRNSLFLELQECIGQLEFTPFYNQCLKQNVPVGEIKNIAQVLNEAHNQDMILEEIIENTPTKRMSSIAFEIKKGKNL